MTTALGWKNARPEGRAISAPALATRYGDQRGVSQRLRFAHSFVCGQRRSQRRPGDCETDVMNTYLLYCHFQKMRAGLLPLEYEQEMALVKDILDIRHRLSRIGISI